MTPAAFFMVVGGLAILRAVILAIQVEDDMPTMDLAKMLNARALLFGGFAAWVVAAVLNFLAHTPPV